MLGPVLPLAEDSIAHNLTKVHYRTKSASNLLKSWSMSSMRSLTLQNSCSRVDPSKSSSCTKINFLCLESSDSSIRDNTTELSVDRQPAKVPWFCRGWTAHRRRCILSWSSFPFDPFCVANGCDNNACASETHLLRIAYPSSLYSSDDGLARIEAM